MIRTLRQPKWLLFGVVVAVLAGLFVTLGLWQLDRLEQRRTGNSVGEERIGAAPVDLDDALSTAAGDLDVLEYRRVLVSGVFDPGQEVLIRSQVELGQAGFHVITPLVLADGSAVLVNRGWVPISMDDPPVDAVPSPGPVEVEGWLHLTQERPPLGPRDPAGQIQVLNRVDIERIAMQTTHPLAPVYVVAMGEGSDELPVLVDPPDFSDEGPHLGYAIQWFGFAVIAVAGFLALANRAAAKSRTSS